jgi:hypothetical protein
MNDQSAATSARPSRHGKLLGEVLAKFAELGRRKSDAPLPDCCMTCAFRPGSMPNMTAETGLDAFNCVLGVDSAPFACHHGMKDGEPTRDCAGYAAALLVPFEDLKAVVESEPDIVRAEFDAWLTSVDPESELDVYGAARAYARHLQEKAAS